PRSHARRRQEAVKARALEFVAPRALRVIEEDVDDPGEGDLLVQTEWSGISGGTELLPYRGEIDPQLPLDETIGALGGTFAFPFRYGYSCVGTVEQSRDERFGEGSRVFAFHPPQDRFVVHADECLALGGERRRLASPCPL